MLKIVGIMLFGMMVGYTFRKHNLRWIQKAIMVAIWLLLFLLGIAVGLNDGIMNNLDTIGWQALVLAVAATGGSVVLAWVVYRYWFTSK